MLKKAVIQTFIGMTLVIHQKSMKITKLFLHFNLCHLWLYFNTAHEQDESASICKDISRTVKEIKGKY